MTNYFQKNFKEKLKKYEGMDIKEKIKLTNNNLKEVSKIVNRLKKYY